MQPLFPSLLFVLLISALMNPSLRANASVSADTSANASASPATGNDAPGALGGIVVSRTVTVGAQEFNEGFLSVWRDLPGSEHYTLTIVERPSARWGSEVWIEYAQRRIFHTRLPTARAISRRTGEQAAENTYQAVLQAERQRKLIRDADLAPDEF